MSILHIFQKWLSASLSKLLSRTSEVRKPCVRDEPQAKLKTVSNAQKAESLT